MAVDDANISLRVVQSGTRIREVVLRWQVLICVYGPLTRPRRESVSYHMLFLCLCLLLRRLKDH